MISDNPGTGDITIFSNGTIFNPYTLEWVKDTIAVQNGHILGVGQGYHGKEIDLTGRYIVPGFIDAHVHIESSLLKPSEYARLVMQHGTTAVIADPHEIANTCGTAGIDYMHSAYGILPLDIFIMVPSCVPATPLDECAKPLPAVELRRYQGQDGIIGLGEMMNVPGVLNIDPDILEKLSLFSLRDGHAPGLTGTALDRYIFAGLQSDHETISYEEGKEKLQKGMCLFIREGSTERNLNALIPLVNAATVSRCSFCTDDRHVDMLVSDGHIDDCIRKAIEYGCEPEYAYRMASLSPAERFGLHDRGAFSPGMLADFVVLDDMKTCSVRHVYKSGRCINPSDIHEFQMNIPIQGPFQPRLPSRDDLKITGSGRARIIRIMKNQISTGIEYCLVSSENIPDLKRDILKLIVVSRYNPDNIGVGLVQGFGLKQGALACSISHDSHNIIATGVSDEDIIGAISSVISHRGGMAYCHEKKHSILPLSIAGLMSDLPYEQVNEEFTVLERLARVSGAISNPFMYLSFLALSVIPELRVTEKGVFDVNQFSHVPLFTGP